ncbi:MAG: monovalent cation:H+ antiporter-2, family [Betaproteobacteria bacterium]|jgi:CPA2 family monovalent cation:H+ antiporter-2|nr:monovalent cation:H+ antiporter-2, family [Betaproteobacteria bacterium]
MTSAVSLQSVLVLLASAVLAVALCRSLRLPPIVGYLAAGVALGPHAAGLLSNRDELRHLADFGVVFLMFSIGLEFSLSRLVAMRRIVFGFGVAQVALTLVLAIGGTLAAGYAWQTGLALGAIAAMSSTAIVSKLLAERGELDSAHGREVIGVLLFQDLAVVPFLVLLPALDKPGDALGVAVAIALAKAAIALAIVVLAGPRLMRAWLGAVARRRSNELFVLNVLLITLLLAFLTGLAGLSMVLGAFLAGMLISETEYRFQVEEDIKPFRDVLLGLFFITIGAMLDWRLIGSAPGLVIIFIALLVGAKFALIAVLSRLFGATPGTALRVALALAQAGEFGFVLLPLAGGTVPEAILQPLLAAMVISMIATPFFIAASNRIVMRFSRSEWMERSLELHRIATQSIETERHVIVLGYGRNGQRLARLLQAEQVPYVALDLDPERVREAAAAGDRVVFADSVRRDALVAAGISRAAAVVVTFADTAAAVRVLSHIHALNPSVPVIVRARDESDIEPLTAAGATEVVPEAFESGVMLASHTLVVVGVPLSRVMRRVSQVRDERYRLLRGLFHAPGEREDDEGAARLHAVTLDDGTHATGKTLADLDLEALGVEIRGVRRRGARANLGAAEAGLLRAGDVVVMLGSAAHVAAAENRLLRG